MALSIMTNPFQSARVKRPARDPNDDIMVEESSLFEKGYAKWKWTWTWRGGGVTLPLCLASLSPRPP